MTRGTMEQNIIALVSMIGYFKTFAAKAISHKERLEKILQAVKPEHYKNMCNTVVRNCLNKFEDGEYSYRGMAEALDDIENAIGAWEETADTSLRRLTLEIAQPETCQARQESQAVAAGKPGISNNISKYQSCDGINWFSTVQAGILLNMPGNAVRSAIENGHLKAYKPGAKKYYISREALQEFSGKQHFLTVEQAIQEVINENKSWLIANDYIISNDNLFTQVKAKLNKKVSAQRIGKACARLKLTKVRVGARRGWKIL